MSLDIKIDLRSFEIFSRRSLVAEVTFNGFRLFSWQQTDESIDNGIPEFTAIGQFGYEQWYVWSPEGRWVRQFVGGQESPAMAVPINRLVEVSEDAVRDTMGDALELTYHPTGKDDEIDIRLNGEKVLYWGAADDGSGEFIVFDAALSVYFGIWSASTHGFSAWSNGDCEGWPDTFDQDYLKKVCPMAYRALRNGWIAGGVA